MEKMNYPKGLIRYTTHKALEGKKTRIIRPRILVYAFILLSMFTIFTHSVLTRLPLGLDVIRDRNQLYRETRGMIENIYTLKVLNMDDKAHSYRLSVNGIDGIRIDSEQDTIHVEAGHVQDFPVRLQADESNLLKRSNEITLSLVAIDDEKLSVVEHARFLGPIP